jgi:hypothetical protein
MITIKLEIFPSFIDSCCFQLKKQSSSYNLTVQINAADKNQWEVQVSNPDETNSIEDLAKKVVTEAAEDNRIILDGVGLKCTIVENGITKQHKFRCPESGSNELMLVNHFFDLVQKSISEQSYINYSELIEGYFANNLPVKVFEEKPLRLRIYGLLSVYEKEGLTATINKILDRNEIIIDMTNFVSMGTVLYKCFKPLNNIPKLTFLANENALSHIEAMGFDKNVVTLVH